MKCFKIVLFFVFISLRLYAQNPCSIWYYGVGLGVNFNTPGQNPVPIFNGKTHETVLGTATYSINGSIAFYTDGTSVWNANHQVMPNGYLLRDTPLNGIYDQFASTSTTTCGYDSYYNYGTTIPAANSPIDAQTKTIIVPDPGNTSKFYIFSGKGDLSLYSGSGFASNGPAYITYSKVNMNLNGGLGDVELSTKRTLLKLNAGNRNMCVIKHGNNINYWILTLGNTPNTLFAYEISASGVSTTPVVSTFPYSVATTFNLIATSLGTRLAATNSSDSLFLFDFNKWTGIISNRTSISLNNYPSNHPFFPTLNQGGIQSLIFSPNAQLLYFATTQDICQLNLSTNSIYTVIATGVTNNPSSVPSSSEFFSFQMGPNYKIYVSNMGNNSFATLGRLLAVINNPNVVGAACNFVFDLGMTNSFYNTNYYSLYNSCQLNQLSLPNYITSMVAPWINTAPTMTAVNSITKCPYDTLNPISIIVADTETSVGNLTLSASSSNTALLPNSNISISVNGAQRSLQFTPLANQTGTTTISLQLTDTNGLSSTQSFTLTILPSTPVNITSTLPTSVCDGNSVVCSCVIPANCSIEWQSNGVPTGNTSNSYTVNQSANITAVCTSSNGCTSSSNAINVTVRPLPQVQCSVNGPTTICVGDSVQVQALSTAGYSYQWFKNNQLLPNATNAIYYAKLSGDYSYVATLNGCSKTSNIQSIQVVPAPIASISTPNTTVICNGQGALLQATTGVGYTYQWTMNGFDIAGATNPTYTATIGSYYTVKVSNGYCARTSSPITITVNTAPVAIIHWNGTQLFSPISFYSYQWYFNGVLIPGATGQYYTPTQAGLYYVMVGNENGCKSLSPNYNLLTLSINNIATPILSIYPNPTTGMLQVADLKEGTLYVYNAMGQLIIQQTEPLIDLSKQANGIYQIRAYNTSQELIGIGRVVKE
jgi:hypothetical protein